MNDKPADVIHLNLTLVTLGLWGIVWLWVTDANAKAERTVTLNIDKYGNLVRQVANAQQLPNTGFAAASCQSA